MTGTAEEWGSMTNQKEMKSNESKDVELQITIPDDAEYDSEIYLFFRVN